MRDRKRAMSYQDHIIEMGQLIKSKGGAWDGISPEAVARMRLQNRFKTGLEIAKYTADIMRKDMAAYDADPAKYTASGFILGTDQSGKVLLDTAPHLRNALLPVAQ